MVSSKTIPKDLNLKFRWKFNHDFTGHDCFTVIIVLRYTVLTKKEPTKQKMRFLTSWNSLVQPVELTQKLAERTILRLLLINIMLSLMLWNSTYWSCLLLIVQTQPNLHSCDSFIINIHNITDKRVEKYCFTMLNVKL